MGDRLTEEVSNQRHRDRGAPDVVRHRRGRLRPSVFSSCRHCGRKRRGTGWLALLRGWSRSSVDAIRRPARPDRCRITHGVRVPARLQSRDVPVQAARCGLDGRGVAAPLPGCGFPGAATPLHGQEPPRPTERGGVLARPRRQYRVLVEPSGLRRIPPAEPRCARCSSRRRTRRSRHARCR